MNKKLGDKHEKLVAQQLHLRGYAVELSGLEHQRPVFQQQIRAADSLFRFMPDLWATPHRDPNYPVLVECKAQFHPGLHERAISLSCVNAQYDLASVFRMPIYYVFSDLSVSTPQDVKATGRIMPGECGSQYLSVPRDLDRDFNQIFGSIPTEQFETLRSVPMAA